jgi:hypothetical protein
MSDVCVRWRGGQDRTLRGARQGKSWDTIGIFGDNLIDIFVEEDMKHRMCHIHYVDIRRK